MKRKTTEQFIEDAKNVHGNKYDYSKVEYINARTKVCIICPIHGEFWIKPNDHLNGHGCRKCHFNKLVDIKRCTTESFIEKAVLKYGDKYDYSKVEYKDHKTKVCIICPIHGEFWQTPNKFLNGRECPKCTSCELLQKKGKSFINRARIIHNDKYDYSKVEYKGNKTKVCIICPIHGEFWQTPNSHLSGEGCNLCVRPIHDTSTFIEEARKVHGDKYDYSKVKYKNCRTKVCMICKEHGEFWQEPIVHTSQKCGCPICSQSHLESETRIYLEKKGIKFFQEKMFNWLGLMRIDFYLPEHNIAIECQGIQHSMAIDFFGGEKEYKELLKRDKLKNQLCKEHGIKIIYVNYNEDTVEQLNEKLN